MTQDRPDERHRLVHLRFRPLWLYVDAVREFCGFFARASFENDQLGQRVGIVVHELVENAVRYGDERELELMVERSDADIVVRVANTATEAQIDKLRDLIEQLSRHSPGEAYALALKHAASLPKTESGLGLPRIRYEGQVELDLETSPGRVSITARGTA